ncbi:MAG: hypothetical protein KC729_21195, partial [Candidatus Eisenbacteria bacterium]|nr:hypothetical protein [Candidatus Eisenbacteria bacterium]
DIEPSGIFAAPGSDPITLGEIGGRIIFATASYTGLPPVWSTDGTPEGTFPLPAVCSEYCDSRAAWVGTSPHQLFFLLRSGFGAGHTRIFATDGSVSGTVETVLPPDLAVAVSQPDGVSSFLILDERLLFQGSHPGPGYTLFSTGGSFAPLENLASSRAQFQLAALGDRVLAFSPSFLYGNSTEIRSTDGTPSGTLLIATVGDLQDVELATSGGSVVYFQGTGPGGVELWRSDGTSEGTFPISNLPDPNAQILAIRSFTDGVVATFRDVTMGTEVLISGGTIATTRIATSTGFDGSFEDSWSPDRFVALGSVALIIGSDGLRNTLLYSVPLASGPLVQLTDLCQPHCQGEVWIRRLGARAVFPVQRPGGPELWATEGSTSSTRKIADFCDLPCDGQLRPIASDGERLLFAAPGEHGSFWMTSGTIADTFSITDSSPASVTAPVGSASNRWAESGLGVAFPGRDAAHGAELWIGSLASRTSNLILDLNTTVPRNGRRFGAGTGGSANFILRDDSGLQYRVWHIDSPFDAVTLVEGLALPAIETYGPNDQLYA